ncbi:long-chain-fatty-acid--CoA ligase [Alkalihalobacillus deserti]|uniref:long-chain-fatty-acid--CoA ligase n=1 Tax=Alkalihalobacillus deserti TaxID=2879466 RepID=UPI001D15C378|nr:long-chain-fatty-acid--CoA ligase [Alkalihalobacillus deserti]
MNHQLFIPDFLKRAVTYYPDKIAVIDNNIRLTYRQFQERVNRLSNLLINLGVEKGDRVAYLAPNTLQMLEGFYGVMQIGAIMVPFNTRLIPSDYDYMINHSGAKVLLVDAELSDLIEPVKEGLTGVEHFIILPFEEEQKKEGWKNYEDLLNQASLEAPPIPQMNELDIANILYTSGTTGRPKGVMHSHRSLYFNALNTIIHLRAADKDTLLHTLPLFHVNGWGTPFAFTGMGATHVMLRKINPRLIFDLIEKENVTVSCMAPTVLNMLLNEPKSTTLEVTHDIRVVIAGSAPPPSFIKLVEEELGFEFIQVYGMTEAAPFLTVGHIKSHLNFEPERVYHLKAKTGIAMLNMDVRVINEHGDYVKPNGKEVGEIITSGNSVMEGYWKQPEETAKSIVNGWYYTGDMATVDEEGYVEIVDRKKDIIISGGENISTIEVEGEIYKHPAILEVSVIAVPDEKWGEIPHAICVLKEGHSLTEDEFITFCRGNLPHFKAPKSVQFMSELPKTASGKIQKNVLREPYWKEKGRKVN